MDQKKEFAPLAHDEIEKPLIKSAKSLMVVSLDVITAGVKAWPTSCFPGGTPYHRVNSETRRIFRKSHREALSDLGLNPRDYDFQRFRLEGRKYKRFNLPSFSITIVQNNKLRGVELC